MEAANEATERIHEVIQTEARGEAPGVLLTGWVIVAEWMHPDGSKMLTRVASANLEPWQARGVLGEAADFYNWPWEEDEDADPA